MGQLFSSTVLEDAGAWETALWWGAFAVTHVGLSHPPVRSRLVRALGEKGYMALYNVVSLTYFGAVRAAVNGSFSDIPAALADARQRATPTSAALIGLGVLFMSSAFTQPTPVAITTPGGPGARDALPKGLSLLVRHPLFFGTALLGTGAALNSETPAGQLFWAAHVPFWLVGGMHQDYRFQSRTAGFLAQSTLLPNPAKLGEALASAPIPSYAAAIATAAAFSYK